MASTISGQNLIAVTAAGAIAKNCRKKDKKESSAAFGREQPNNDYNRKTRLERVRTTKRQIDIA